MVPPTISTRLHYIRGVVTASRARGQTTKLFEFIRSRDASAMARESWPKYVTYEHHVVVDTNRTTDFGLITEVARSAQ